MATRVEAIVKPEILVWARESAGLTLEIAAKKAQVKVERLGSWERGEKRPTIKQLRKLGQIYRRPIAVFYLPEPPKKFMPMRDFRRLPGQIAGRQSPELRFEIRRAIERREIAIDLHRDLELSPPELAVSADLSEDAEGIAGRLRKYLQITYDKQIAWGDPYEAFNSWRSALEALGVLIFQATDVDLDEMRGFSISDLPLPAISLNIKDSPRGRIFTMLHEFAHIALRRGGLCDLEEDQSRPPEEQQIEVFCNRVAGATLIPASNLLQERLVAGGRETGKWSDDDISQLARRYNASREAILRRLLILDLTTQSFYREKRKQYREEYRSRQKRAGFAPPDVMAVSSAGPLFVRLALNCYYQEKITSSDLADFLGVRLKHMPKIEKAVFGQPVALGA